jgi:hypothetical protein
LVKSIGLLYREKDFSRTGYCQHNPVIAPKSYRRIAVGTTGVQRYGYALFLMNQKVVDWVNNTRGSEIGSGPSVVIVDKGMARSFTTDTLHSGIYAFTFDQQGSNGRP